MKTMMVAVMSLLLVSMPLAMAQSDTDIVTPSVLPDSPFYGINRGFENVQLWFALNEADKAKLHYKFALNRLAEAKQMALKNNVQLTETALTDYENELNQTDYLIEKAIARGNNMSGLEEQISNDSSKHYATMVNITVTLQNRSITITVPDKFAEKFFDKVERIENRTSTISGEKADKAMQAIEAAQLEIDKASLLNLTGVNLKLLENAKLHLADAEDAFKNGYYGNAFGQATAARSLAINAQKIKSVIPENETETPENETEGNHTGNESQIGSII